MPSYHMLPNVCLCGGGVRAVGARVGLCQLSMGVDMVIQVAPEKPVVINPPKDDLFLNKLKPHHALKTFPQPGCVQVN